MRTSETPHGHIAILIAGMLALFAPSGPRAHAQVIAGGAGHSLAVRGDGTVAAWGADRPAIWVPAKLDRVTSVASGFNHGLALREDGTPVAWGYPITRNEIDFYNWAVPPGVADVVAIACGDYHSMAVRSDGAIAVWGTNRQTDKGQTKVPAGLKNVTAVAGGYLHCLALRSDGTVVAWGDNTEGQTKVPAGLKDVVAISAGRYQSLALRSDGTVVSWGNMSPQKRLPGPLTDIVSIACTHVCNLALKSDGTVVAWGGNYNGAADVPADLKDVVAIAGGGSHGLALKSDGTLVTWGGGNNKALVVPPGLTLPGAVSWKHPKDGLFLAAHNWKHAAPSTAAADAIFDVAGKYTVKFTTDARAKSITIRQGDVTFDLGGNTFTCATKPTIAAGAKFTVTNGTLKTAMTEIGTVDNNVDN